METFRQLPIAEVLAMEDGAQVHLGYWWAVLKPVVTGERVLWQQKNCQPVCSDNLDRLKRAWTKTLVAEFGEGSFDWKFLPVAFLPLVLQVERATYFERLVAKEYE